MIVLDASAVLVFLKGEPGATEVEEGLEDGAVCGAANWSEIAQKVTQHGGSWPAARALLMSYPVDVEPVCEADAEAAATLWTPGGPLSLGDRLCLALAQRLDTVVYTADRAWGSSARIKQIRP